MKASVLLIYFSVFTCVIGASQDNYFEPDRPLKYRFTYLNFEYDTMAVGAIEITPTNKPWKYDVNQKEVRYEYHFSKRVDNYFRIGEHGLPINNKLSEVTGYREDDSSFWMHPFRTNIFYITEIAPFPYFAKGTGVIKRKDVLYIGDGWGKFKGKSKSNYEVFEFRTEARHTTCQLCKKVKMRSKNRLGKSYLELIVSEKDGIIEMRYDFFNHDKLIIVKI